MVRTSRGGRPRSSEFFDRAEPDAISLPEGAVDGPGFGDAHLGAVDQGRDVGRVGVTVADEAFRGGFVEDGGPKDPTIRGRVTELVHLMNSDSNTPSAQGQAQ